MTARRNGRRPNPSVLAHKQQQILSFVVFGLMQFWTSSDLVKFRSAMFGHIEFRRRWKELEPGSRLGFRDNGSRGLSVKYSKWERVRASVHIGQMCPPGRLVDRVV